MKIAKLFCFCKLPKTSLRLFFIVSLTRQSQYYIVFIDEPHRHTIGHMSFFYFFALQKIKIILYELYAYVVHQNLYFVKPEQDFSK